MSKSWLARRGGDLGLYGSPHVHRMRHVHTICNLAGTKTSFGNAEIVHSVQMMEQAQNMMRNMSPEQMANMRQMVSQMSPDQMEHMQRMVSNMGIGGSPGAASQSSQAAYHLSGAHALKEDGNALHKAGNHASALVKYDKALENLAEQSCEEALSLKTSCELNKAICHLKLEQWLDCEKICSQVLMRAVSLCTLVLTLTVAQDVVITRKA